VHPIHPVVVHFPLALLSASVLFDLLARRWRRESFQETGFYVLIAGLLGAVVAVVTGGLAEDAVKHRGVPHAALEVHETLAYATLYFFIGLLALRLLMRWKLIREMPLLYLVMGVVGILILAATGYFGGSLVYDYGAGVSK